MTGQPLPDGVYLGLPEEEYFDQPRLGSSDFATLYSKREGWWWQSRNNPHLEPRSSKATEFGSALHKLLLEGPAAYRDAFAVAPDQKKFPGVLVSVADLCSALAAGGVEHNPKSRKHDLVQLAVAYLDAPVWDHILAAFERKARGRQVISAAEDFALQTMRNAALEDPDMSVVVNASELQRLTEVSVLWTSEQGLPMRFRFDCMLPSWNVDLKSIGNIRKELDYAVGDAVATYHLDVQLALSFEARQAAYALIRAGSLHGGTDDQRAFLSQFPDRAPLRSPDGAVQWHWLWMFYQKPDDKGDAPVIFPVRVFHGDERHRIGWRKAEIAKAFYLEAVGRFGLDRPWTRVDPMHDANHTGERRVKFPPWENLPGPVEGEDEAFS